MNCRPTTINSQCRHTYQQLTQLYINCKLTRCDCYSLLTTVSMSGMHSSFNNVRSYCICRKFESTQLLAYISSKQLSEPNRVFANRTEPNSFRTESEFFSRTEPKLKNLFRTSLTFANSNHNTRGHAYKLLPSHCRVNVRKGFFCRKGS